MKKMSLFESVIVLSSIIAGFPANAQSTHVYPGGVQVAMQIGSDLYDSLDAKYRNKLQSPPLATVSSETPVVVLSERNQVSISTGFVDLINHIAHAKAIDRIQPGYFDQYMSSLAGQAQSGTLKAPEIAEDRYWADSVMNDQASFFNQMIGLTVAINLSHSYLGQFNRHASQLESGKLVPINNYLTASEWDTGVRAGAVNSLNCAYSTEGAKALFAAIDKMPHRPAWTAYIVPQNVDIKRLNKQLARYEVDFFHGQLN